MKLLRHFFTSEFAVLPNPWTVVTRWLDLTQPEFDRLDDPTQSQLLSRIREYGESTFASQRINSLRPLAAKRYSPKARLLTKIPVVLIGSLTFSLGAKVFELHLGPLAPFIVGGLASAAVDSLATRTFTNWHRLRQVHRKLAQLNRQVSLNPAGSVLKHYLHIAQRQLLEQVEGDRRVWQLPIYALTAGSLSLCELAITIFVVWNFQETRDLATPIKGALAAFPVLLTWAASLMQSTYFEQPDEAANLIPQYQHYLLPDISLAPDETRDWLVQRNYEDGKTDTVIQYVLSGDANNRIKNVRMARANYDMQYYERYLQGLEQHCNRLIMERWQAFQAEQDRLPHEAPVPPVIEKNRAPQEIYEQQRNQAIARRRWVEQEQPRLLARCKQDILALKADFTAAIRQQRRKLRLAQADFNQGYQDWQSDQAA